MRCESCGENISSKMHSAIQVNSCPFCGGIIMPPERKRQLNQLLSVLRKQQFTNKPDTDELIIHKVAEVLLDNFKLDPRSEEQTSTQDVIKVDDELVRPRSVSEAPSRDIHEAAASRPKPLTPKGIPAPKASLPSIYREAADSAYNTRDLPEEAGEDDVDPAEFFPSEAVFEEGEKVKHLKSLAPGQRIKAKTMNEVSGNGGITRRS